MATKPEKQVRCGQCEEFHNEKDVGILNVTDSPNGEVATFVCPGCQTTQKSVIIVSQA